MTNGDKIRSFSDEQLAFVLVCPVETCLTNDDESITIKKDSGKCENENCTKCVYEWLQQEESE